MGPFDDSEWGGHSTGQKAIGLVGTRGYIPDVAFMSTADAMRSVGNNTGNLVFQHACFSQIQGRKLLIGSDVSWNPVEVRNRCRVIVVPSANFIRENFDLSGFVDFLEKVELPLVFVGLGAQASDFEVRTFTFHPSIERLLALLKERCKLIAVRGKYSQEILESLGVTNTVVTGCPSNFVNTSTELADMIREKLKRPMRRFITHMDEPWPKNPDKQKVERRLLAWTREGAAIQVQQSVPVFMEYLRENNHFGGAEVPERRETLLQRALMPEDTLEQFQDYVAAKLRVYFCVHQWYEDSSKFDFSVGLRLHGNMVAWQTGTPALWIYHDSRTHELVETMALPRISLADFLANCHSITDAWDRMTFDEEAYRTSRTRLAGELSSVYAASGLTAAAFLAKL